MKKIAIVTPWPPQTSGIADYVFDLVQGLTCTNFKPDIFTNCDNPAPLKDVNIFNIKTDYKKLSQYDLIIYQIGNNYDFHGYMMDLLQEYQGIVHLHDIVLQHMLAQKTYAAGKDHEYFSMIRKWYGEIKAKEVQSRLQTGEHVWESPDVTNIPLFEEALEYTTGCIVHSSFAQRKIVRAFPKLKVFKIDQIYKGINISPYILNTNSKSLLKLGIFGGVNRNKQVDIVLKVFKKLLHQYPHCQLHIVGEIQKNCQNVQNLIQDLQLKNNIYVHGRVDEKTFNKIFDAIDICINLRYPTMGETSAIVMRSMQRGVPVIVTDTGWYAELPHFVSKISGTRPEQELFRILKKYIHSKSLFKLKKYQFIRFAQRQLSFETAVNNYTNIIEYFLEQVSEDVFVKQVSSTLHELEFSKNNFFLETIVRKTKDLF